VRQARGAGTLQLVNVPVPHRQYTYEEYLQLEEYSDVRHEFFNGDIFAMTGGTPNHAMLAARAIVLLNAGLAPGYALYTGDLRVHIPLTGLSTYPDVAILPGKRELAPIDKHAVINPVVLVEVTSPSTESYDRQKKIKHYQQLPALQHVLFISHREARLTLVSRQSDGTWSTTEATAGQTLELPAVRSRLSVDEMYLDVFDPPV
jgi:Uma2 family endonuclease